MSQKSLRVLHVLGELRPSGAESMLVAAGPLFQECGVEAEVLSTGLNVGPYADRFEAAGYRVHHIPFERSLGFFRRERELMREGGFDVIHLHTEAANFWQGIAARSIGRAIVVRTIHSSFGFTGNLRFRRGMQRHLLRWLGVSHVAVSKSVQGTEWRHYRLPTKLIWNWYDSERFTATSEEQRRLARAQFNIRDSDFVVASVGNCGPIKNHGEVIRAIALLDERERPTYLHAGIEEPGNPERLLARNSGVGDRVIFLGRTADVLPVLRAADAFVMPSLHEGFGIAAVEALSTGLPTLLADVPGLRDFRECFRGLIYSGTDAEGIAAGLRALMRVSSEERSIIHAEYPVLAERCFGMKRGVRDYAALYAGREVFQAQGLTGEVK